MINRSNRLIIWSKVVDIVTIFWLLHYMVDLFTSLFSKTYSSFFSYFLYTFFIVDLIIIFITHNSKKQFFKESWFDILMVLPLFRLLRFFKILRIRRLKNLWRFLNKSKKLKRGKKLVTETFDLGRQISDNVKR